MLYDAKRTHHAGRQVPRHTVHMRDAVRGRLIVAGEWYEDRNRQGLTARLTGPGGDLLPPLRDAVLLHAGDSLVLTGVERIADERGLSFAAEYAQSWVLVPAYDRDLQRLADELAEATRLREGLARQAGFGNAGH